MTRLTVRDFPPSDQHRLQEWVRSLSGALTAARPALPAVCFRFERRNEVRSSLWMFKSFIFTSPFTARTSPCHYSDSSQRIKKGKKKKSGQKISHLQRIQTQNPQMVCEYRWQTAMTAVRGKEAPSWVALWQLFCLHCELRALICLRNSPCRMRGWEGGCRSCF